MEKCPHPVTETSTATNVNKTSSTAFIMRGCPTGRETRASPEELRNLFQCPHYLYFLQHYYIVILNLFHLAHVTHLSTLLKMLIKDAVIVIIDALFYNLALKEPKNHEDTKNQ